MIASIEALHPHSRCVDFVPLQQRQPHHLALYLATVLAIGVPTFILGTTYYPDGPPWFVFPAFFAALMAAQVAGTSYWVLAWTETEGLDEVKLARSSWITGKATKIHRSFASPVEHTLGGGLLSFELTIDGERFFVARTFRSRLRSITGLLNR